MYTVGKKMLKIGLAGALYSFTEAVRHPIETGMRPRREQQTA